MAKVGREDVVLVDRLAGLRRRPLALARRRASGELVPARGATVVEEGIRPTTASSASSPREGDHVAKADGFAAIRDINPQAETHLLVPPSGTSTPSATSTRSRPRRRSECSSSSRWRDAGLTDYRVTGQRGPGGGQTIFHLHWHVLGGKITDARMTIVMP